MKRVNYLKDHVLSIVMYSIQLVFVVSVLLVFKVNYMLFAFTVGAILLSGCLIFVLEYKKRTSFLTSFQKQVNQIEKKYLSHELMREPSSHEERTLYDAIYDINVCMMNELNTYKSVQEDFKQYLELWVHEIKIPLASARLLVENNKHTDIHFIQSLNRIDKLVDQVLFYVRSEHVEKDYMIKTCNMNDLVKKVIVEERSSFIHKKINLQLETLDVFVQTDAKWMEFIIHQILSNSIKYAKEEEAYIRIYCKEDDNYTSLYIEDNGIGIAKSDLFRVFEKGFTGSNGRMKYKSTGIGLYLCKSLCEKMHHHIEIQSVVNERTVVKIVFPKSDMLQVVQ